MKNYKLVITEDFTCQIIDVEIDTDLSSYIAICKSKWSSIITKAARSNRVSSSGIESHRGIRVFEDEDGKVYPVDVSVGDPIPKGCVSMSSDIQHLVLGYGTSIRNTNRLKWDMLNGHKLIHKEDLLRGCHLRSGRTPSKDIYHGWSVQLLGDNQGYYGTSLRSDSEHWLRMGTNSNNRFVKFHQPLRVSAVGGRESIRIRCPGVTLIMINGENLAKEGDVWTWTGPPVTKDLKLDVIINDTGRFKEIEVLDD